MAAFSQFYNLAGRSFASINTALVALIPKKDGASSIVNFRPISLIHSVAKLIAKVLSMRLATVIHT
uniref:Reverse transcriptase domain-containing protein n=1 Tax=Aegilops tauschii subsp. strangulata TaxID=200361 RepID=A0A453D091_AEGTS